MDIEQQIFGLMAAAQEQQKAAETATQSLGIQTEELKKIVEQLSTVLNALPQDLDKIVGDT